MRQGRVLQARSEGSVRLYSTRAASEARREIARNAPPSVVFYETAVFFFEKTLYFECYAVAKVILMCYIFVDRIFQHHFEVKDEKV